MKKARILALAMAVVCILSAVGTAFALENRASEQINSYSMDVLPTSGLLNVEFTIFGNGDMSKIGCESIYVYKKVGSSWYRTDYMSEDDAGMSVSDTYVHCNCISFSREEGVDYKIIVTLFAQDDHGRRDTRSKTFYR